MPGNAKMAPLPLQPNNRVISGAFFRVFILFMQSHIYTKKPNKVSKSP